METRKRQKGTVAIIAALSLPILIGFAGLALDVGRLYVEKTELQNATDACALAASRELTCGRCCPLEHVLNNAEDSGLTVARLNKVGLSICIYWQRADLSRTISSSVRRRLGPIPLYAPKAPTPLRIMSCAPPSQTGIVPWFMQVLNIGSQTVNAMAVAGLAPAQTNCAIPIGMCMLPGQARQIRLPIWSSVNG